MGAHKVSISMEEGLLELARTAADEEGTGLSAWISDAVRERVRYRALRAALDSFAQQHGKLTADEVEAIVAETRKHSIVVRPRKKRA